MGIGPTFIALAFIQAKGKHVVISSERRKEWVRNSRGLGSPKELLHQQ
jgi:hypothetical protein